MTVPFSQVVVGGFTLREDWTVAQSGNSLSLNGSEGSPPKAAALVRATHHNISGLQEALVPVVFTGKSQLTGFYRVSDADSSLYERQGVLQSEWSLNLERFGSGRDVEIESRSDFLGKTTDHAVAPVFWHAPAVGFSSYWTGSATPSGSVVRQSVDGPVTVNTGVPTTYAPRWTVMPEDYLRGSAQMTVAGLRRLGTFTPDAAVWEVSNGLVRLSSPGTNGQFGVACWDGSQWRSDKSIQVMVGTGALASQPEVTVIRNEPEEVVVRLSYPQTSGRVTVDLGLRRGSRFVTGVMRRHTSATLGVRIASLEAGTTETGRLRATANDSDGNRYVIGTAKTFTSPTAAHVARSSTTTFDFFIGHAVGGLSAQGGDTPADLLGQYLGSTGERTVIVRR